MPGSTLALVQPHTATDLTIPDNREQATWELRRALDSGDDLWLARWARYWGESAMRALMGPR